jgi:hypothetical protein
MFRKGNIGIMDLLPAGKKQEQEKPRRSFMVFDIHRVHSCSFLRSTATIISQLAWAKRSVVSNDRKFNAIHGECKS